MYPIALTLLLIIACQWIAWRFRLPAIVLLTLAGITLGPITGYLHPVELLGDYWPILISLCVAVILFDGGLNLNFHELSTTRRAVLQLIWLGAPLGAVINSVAAHYIAGLSWQTSSILGCILVVTGPTVIMPLLRQARLSARVAGLLKWEGIFNDPTGVLFAVLVFEYLTEQKSFTSVDYAEKLLGIISILVTSWGFTRGLVWAFANGHVPEYLKAPVVLASVVCVYALAGSVHDEGGLIAVTVMGITMANSRLQSLEDIRSFKEVISLLLVSMIFILITATLTRADLAEIGLRDLFFVAFILFVARPLTVWLGTLGAGLSFKERWFISWIAPRGVVCAVISGYLGQKLLAQGVGDAARLVPLAFGTIFVTMFAHGFTVRPLGERLGLAASRSGGILIVGSYPWVIELAKLASEKNVTVKIVDHDWNRLKLAKNGKLDHYYGHLLLRNNHNLDFYEYTHLLAATDDFAFNGLLCAKLRHEFERNNVFQITGDGHEKDALPGGMPALFGMSFLPGLTGDVITQRMKNGWVFKTVKLTADFTYDQYKKDNEDVTPMIMIEESGRFKLIGEAFELASLKDITLISLVKTKESSVDPRTSGVPAPSVQVGLAAIEALAT